MENRAGCRAGGEAEEGAAGGALEGQLGWQKKGPEKELGEVLEEGNKKRQVKCKE